MGAMEGYACRPMCSRKHRKISLSSNTFSSGISFLTQRVKYMQIMSLYSRIDWFGREDKELSHSLAIAVWITKFIGSEWVDWMNEWQYHKNWMQIHVTFSSLIIRIWSRLIKLFFKLQKIQLTFQSKSKNRLILSSTSKPFYRYLRGQSCKTAYLTAKYRWWHHRLPRSMLHNLKHSLSQPVQ